MATERMNTSGNVRRPAAKFSIARCDWAPQYASAGTLTSPILSRSILILIRHNAIITYLSKKPVHVKKTIAGEGQHLFFDAMHGAAVKGASNAEPRLRTDSDIAVM